MPRDFYGQTHGDLRESNPGYDFLSHIYIYIYICEGVYIYLYIYIYRKRESLLKDPQE